MPKFGDFEDFDISDLASEVEEGDPAERDDLPFGETDTDDGLATIEAELLAYDPEFSTIIQSVKRRSAASGGYITYGELDKIIPKNIEAWALDKIFRVVIAQGIEILHEDGVKKFRERKRLKDILY